MAGTIGLLTGTFDPPHLGHVGLSQAALAAGGLDEVWWLVNAHPEHKGKVTPYNQRRTMAELAVAGQPGLQLASPGDSARPHTMAGFRQLMAGYPERSFVFIIGMDTLRYLPSWDDYQTVVETASFMVAYRPDTPAGVVDEVRRQLGALGDRLHVQLFEFAAAREASSTLARDCLRRGERPSFVTESVVDYVRRATLY